MDKTELQDRIDQDVIDFIRNGGEVTYCPTMSAQNPINVSNAKTARASIPRFTKNAIGDQVNAG